MHRFHDIIVLFHDGGDLRSRGMDGGGVVQAPQSQSQQRHLAAFRDRRANELFTFLRHVDTDATNWRGEHAMRQAVVNRKVWGGTAPGPTCGRS